MFFAVERMMGAFYEERRTNNIVMFLSFLAVFIMVSSQHFFFRFHPPMHRVIFEIPIAFISYFIITLNYKSSIAKRLVTVVSIYLFFLLMNLPVSFIFLRLFPDSPAYGEDMITLQSIVMPPLAYLGATLFRRFKNIKKNTTFPRMAIVVPLSIIFVLFLVFSLPFAYFLDISILEDIVLIIVGASAVGAIFLIFYLYDTLSAKYEDKLKSELQALEKEYYYTQCRLMQESMEKVKSIQHDMKLHLVTLKDYSVDNKAATDYLNILLENVEESETYSDTGNIAIDSIINFKLKNAKEDNIKLDLMIAVPPAINVEVVDIVTILGNLLDNAIDAVAKVDKRIIKLNIAFDKGGLFVKIENSFNGEINYSGEQQILTLKNEDGHGYGLKNIRQSVEKYNGYMKHAHDGNTFSTVVFLYIADS
jgi:sensor histidine kinase YesM